MSERIHYIANFFIRRLRNPRKHRLETRNPPFNVLSRTFFGFGLDTRTDTLIGRANGTPITRMSGKSTVVSQKYFSTGEVVVFPRARFEDRRCNGS